MTFLFSSSSLSSFILCVCECRLLDHIKKVFPPNQSDDVGVVTWQRRPVSSHTQTPTFFIYLGTWEKITHAQWSLLFPQENLFAQNETREEKIFTCKNCLQHISSNLLPTCLVFWGNASTSQVKSRNFYASHSTWQSERRTRLAFFKGTSQQKNKTNFLSKNPLWIMPQKITDFRQLQKCTHEKSQSLIQPEREKGFFLEGSEQP